MLAFALLSHEVCWHAQISADFEISFVCMCVCVCARACVFVCVCVCVVCRVVVASDEAMCRVLELANDTVKIRSSEGTGVSSDNHPPVPNLSKFNPNPTQSTVADICTTRAIFQVAVSIAGCA